MEYKQIQELIKTINKSNISELSIEEGDFKITIKQEASQPQYVTMQQAPMQMQAPLPVAQQSAPQAQTAAAPATEKPAAPPAASNTSIIKSPMIGTFYRAPSPEAAHYVEVGTEVGPDTVVCIIEAMKVMNEIKAEAKGVITQALVENGKPVEFGQPLFKIRPT